MPCSRLSEEAWGSAHLDVDLVLLVRIHRRSGRLLGVSLVVVWLTGSSRIECCQQGAAARHKGPRVVGYNWRCGGRLRGWMLMDAIRGDLFFNFAVRVVRVSRPMFLGGWSLRSGGLELPGGERELVVVALWSSDE